MSGAGRRYGDGPLEPVNARMCLRLALSERRRELVAASRAQARGADRGVRRDAPAGQVAHVSAQADDGKDG
jgi:hypothetical protein